jgi:hypothetical protein
MSDCGERVWAGPSAEATPLAALLADLDIPAGATKIILTGSDGYRQEVALDVLRADSGAMVVTLADGTRRAVIPTQRPRYWVKALASIEAH